VHQIGCKYQVLLSFSFLGLVGLQTGLERYVLLLSQPLVRVSPLSGVARGMEEGGRGRREGREGVYKCPCVEGTLQVALAYTYHA
jgi:hypothetical protein